MFYITNMKINRQNNCSGGWNPYKDRSSFCWIRANLVWLDANNVGHVICEMDTGHIQNCIIVLTEKARKCSELGIGVFFRNGYTSEEWIQLFRNELDYRGVI